jgi:hypothetical protein
MVDDSDAANFLMAFFDEMNGWGKQMIAWHERDNGDLSVHLQDAKDALEPIFARYVTDRERKTGRLDAMSYSLHRPDYDRSVEAIDAITRPTSTSFLIETILTFPENGYQERYRFKIILKGGVLRLDKREQYMSYKGKWVKDII